MAWKKKKQKKPSISVWGKRKKQGLACYFATPKMLNLRQRTDLTKQAKTPKSPE